MKQSGMLRAGVSVWTRAVRVCVRVRGEQGSKEGVFAGALLFPECDSPRKGSYEGDKLVELGRAGPRQHRAEEHGAGAEDVLLPLDARVVLAAAREEARLHNAHRGEELQRDREQNRDRVYCVCQRIVLARRSDTLGAPDARGDRAQAASSATRATHATYALCIPGPAPPRPPRPRIMVTRHSQRNCDTCTNFWSCGRFVKTTVCTSLPYAA